MINMEAERFLNANGVGQYESMDIDDSDNILLENIHSVDLPPAQEASTNPAKHRKLSDREDDEYSAEQILPLTLLSEHSVHGHEMVSTPLISSSAVESSQQIRCILPSIVRSNQSLNGYQATSRCVFYMFDRATRGVR